MSKGANGEVPFQAFHPSLTVFVHFAHRPDGLFDKRAISIFLQTDDATKVVQHGPLVLADDVIIEGSNQADW